MDYEIRSTGQLSTKEKMIGSHACLSLPVLTDCRLSRSLTQWVVAYPPSGLAAEVYGRVASPSRMHNSTNYNKWSS